MSGAWTPKNFDAAIIALRCRHRYCTHTFRATGEEYTATPALSCPECGGETRIDLVLLRKLHQKQTRLLQMAKARMQRLGV